MEQSGFSSQAAGIIQELKPYLAVMGQPGADTRFKLASRLLLAISARFNQTLIPKASLNTLLSRPTDNAALSSFQVQLEKILKVDNVFSQDLQTILESKNTGAAGKPADPSTLPLLVRGEGDKTVILEAPPVTFPPIPNNPALTQYLKYMIERSSYVQFTGLRLRGRLVNLELEHAFQPMRTTKQQSVSMGEGVEQEGQGLYSKIRASLREMLITIPVSIDQSLAAHRHLIVLGETGSGKTTLLRYLTLLYARDLAENETLVLVKLGLKESCYLPLYMPVDQIASTLKVYFPDTTETQGPVVLPKIFLHILRSQKLDLPDNFFDPFLVPGKAIFLLDGLDDIPDPGLRQLLIRLIESFIVAYPTCRIVLTSREGGYNVSSRLQLDFVTTRLGGFNAQDMEVFLRRWQYLFTLERHGKSAETQDKADEFIRPILIAIHSNEFVYELCSNPLLLSLMALVYNHTQRLPEYRADLFNEAIRVLFSRLEDQLDQGGPTNAEVSQLSPDEKEKVLQQIALSMHQARYKSISMEALWRFLAEKFVELLPNRRGVRVAVEDFLRMVEKRTGVLVVSDDRKYTFSHRSFQEFLTAEAILDTPNYRTELIDRCDDIWWREVILLSCGYLSLSDATHANELIQAIADRRNPANVYFNLALAADCMRDAGFNRLGINKIVRQLRKVLEAPLNRAESQDVAQAVNLLTPRMIATQSLVRAGGGYWSGLNCEPEWIKIPKGNFLMGNDRGEPDERPAHNVYLDEYFISHTPISNAQYARFVKETGHKPPSYWDANRPPRGKESHPVVGVNFFDTLAYCKWLSLVTGREIVLPSEAEWEKAAHGPTDTFDTSFLEALETSGFYYNTFELNLMDTTPVGTFPEPPGATYGALDMLGNIWEWTRSLWGRQAFETDYRYPYKPMDGRENLGAPVNIFRVLRGGSFFYNLKVANCSYRYRNYPEHGYYDLGFRVVAKSK
jgi:formylglycine-generating enzyme required for sulfatase activity